MPDFARVTRGLFFEQQVADALGLKKIAGSGSSWRSKGDGRGKLRVSAKAESTKSWNRVRAQLDEAVDMAHGTGESPVLALLDDDERAFIVMRLEDYAELLAEDVVLQPKRHRGDEVRERAETPSLLRGDS